MRWLTLLVLLLATVAVYSEDEVETGSGEANETEGTEEQEEEVDDWEDDGVSILSAENFEEFIKENEFVLVEFYAPWCGHCKTFAPEYAKLANELEEKSSPIKVVKVDATKDSKYTEEYGVRGYPTLKLFRRGTHTEYWGPKAISNIVDWLNKKTGPSAIDIKSVEDAEEFIKSQSVAVIGFFNDYESEEAKAFLRAADSIDDYRSGITKNQDVYKKYEAKSGSIILFKNFDEGQSNF
ncbi:hypothetical protein HA402_008389 [Bradysia odoriphaga]|nr:hypothetical protein HA402_008389 [Bradysia odoriphaga]